MKELETQGDPITALIFPILFSLIFGIIAYKLAKDKGRNIVLWTFLGCIPGVNFICMWYFVGAANIRLEEKIDQLIAVSGKS